MRREVPLSIQPQPGCHKQSLEGLHRLLDVLFKEEQQAFRDALAAATDRWGVAHFPFLNMLLSVMPGAYRHTPLNSLMCILNGCSCGTLIPRRWTDYALIAGSIAF